MIPSRIIDTLPFCLSFQFLWLCETKTCRMLLIWNVRASSLLLSKLALVEWTGNSPIQGFPGVQSYLFHVFSFDCHFKFTFLLYPCIIPPIHMHKNHYYFSRTAYCSMSAVKKSFWASTEVRLYTNFNNLSMIFAVIRQILWVWEEYWADFNEGKGKNREERQKVQHVNNLTSVFPKTE